jgi:hypothetical protein
LNREVAQIIAAQTVQDGAGVSIYRSIGSNQLRSLDPFLMLDQFGSSNPDDYVAGFPDHPHRGFITVTYMLDGHMRHQDSMGNSGDLKSGGVQWMKAARGVIHSEMPQQENGLMRGFQLWINLPASEKMSDPEYQDFTASDIPFAAVSNGTIKIIAGVFNGVQGPIADPHTSVVYLDVQLAGAASLTTDTDPSAEHFVYVLDGSALVGLTEIGSQSLAVLSRGSKITIDSGPAGARFIFVGGLPLNEPIAHYGPFVMNTPDEIEQAINDYNSGRLTG